MTELKRVSFKVAKALKQNGYPQGNTDNCYLTADHNQFYKEGHIVDNENREWAVLTKNLADIPTYFEVWLWLLMHNRKSEHIEGMGLIPVGPYTWENGITSNTYSNPEEAIEKAIEYLVENKLLK